MNVNKKILYPVIAAMLSALAYVLMLLEIPLPTSPHLKFDLGDIPALFAGITLGPLWGVLVELLKNLIQLLTKGFGTQLGFGNIMDFLTGCAFIVPFSIIYRSMINKNKKSLFAVTIASIAGTISRVIIGIGANYIVAPLFSLYFLNNQLTQAAILTFVISAIILNSIKSIVLSISSIPLTTISKKFMKH